MSKLKVFNSKSSKWQNKEVDELPLTSVMTITPTQAEILLRNGKNRKLYIAKVNEYERDMRAGKWRVSQDAISFSKNGELLNGQHRLEAVKKCNESQKFVVGFGFTKKDQEVFDVGKKRNLHDVAVLAGIDITRFEAGVARFVRCQTICGNIPKRATREEELDFIREHLDSLRITAEIIKPNVRKDNRTGLNIGNDMGAAFFRAIEFYKDVPKDLKQVKRFADALVRESKSAKLSILYETVDSPIERNRAKILRLYKARLFNLKKSVRGGQDQSGRDYRYKLTEKAITLFCHPPEKEISLLRNDDKELFKLREEY